jgi:hypothetical protein
MRARRWLQHLQRRRRTAEIGGGFDSWAGSEEKAEWGEGKRQGGRYVNRFMLARPAFMQSKQTKTVAPGWSATVGTAF